MPGSPEKVPTWTHDKRYGVEESYIAGMKWLEPCSLVEDWGCGPAYSKKYRVGKYRGIDGTDGFCDLVADLRQYTSFTPGLFMRHVLEHNEDWRLILENAVRSFTERMSLIFFLPFANETRVVSINNGIPDIEFNRDDIMAFVEPYLVEESVISRRDKPRLHDTLLKLRK